MKILFALFLITFSTCASAEFCTAVIKDQYNGYEYQNFTRSSYSYEAACSDAQWDCRRALSDAQSQGRYYNATCVISGYNPPPQILTCETDIVDQYGRVLRQFTANGMTSYEACSQSDQICKIELARVPSYGLRCINRGIINGGGYPPGPGPIVTAECFASRFDPAGMFIERYLGRAQGPRNSDVYGMACNQAMNTCQSRLIGRQFCRIDR